ncbi:MAG TPA: hypothetical protein DIW27_12380 [Cytophagales bacterium]|nr:hypothetical protein [Cytophagales bacterium]HRJ55143.1 hypothetical protein [Anaerolineales bacterium]
MNDLKQDLIEDVNTSLATTYRYLTSGKRWNWGMSATESKLFWLIVSAASVIAVVCAALVLFGAWQIWNLMAGYMTLWWMPVLYWLLILIIMAVASIFLTAGAIRVVVYPMITFFIPIVKNLKDG